MDYWERKENGKVLEIKKIYDSRNDDDLFKLELESQAENMQIVFEKYEARLNQEINRYNELISNEPDGVKLNKYKLQRDCYAEMIRIFKHTKSNEGVYFVRRTTKIERPIETERDSETAERSLRDKIISNPNNFV